MKCSIFCWSAGFTLVLPLDLKTWEFLYHLHLILTILICASQPLLFSCRFSHEYQDKLQLHYQRVFSYWSQDKLAMLRQLIGQQISYHLYFFLIYSLFQSTASLLPASYSLQHIDVQQMMSSWQIPAPEQTACTSTLWWNIASLKANTCSCYYVESGFKTASSILLTAFAFLSCCAFW